MIEELRHFDETRLAELVRAFPSLRVAVIGDFFLDKYLEIDPSLAEASLETGKVANQVVGTRHSPGAAGTVAANLSALMGRSLGAPAGGRLLAIGFRGHDGEGWELERDLASIGADVSGLAVAKGRRTPTYLKPRDIDKAGLEGEHRRYDTKNRSSTAPEIEDEIIKALDEALGRVDALVVMDQVEDEDFGVVTTKVASAIMDRITRLPRLVAWADSRRRIRSFRGLALKMNQFELAGIHDPEPGASLSDSEIARMIGPVEKAAGAPVFVTVGERGVWVGGEKPFLVPGIRIEEPVDPTGAGDSFTAGAVLALASGASRAEAALVGCLVASITVRQLSTTGTARPDELFAALNVWKEQNR